MMGFTFTNPSGHEFDELLYELIHFLITLSLILELKFALKLADVNVETHPKDFKLTPLFKMGFQDVLQFSILSPGKTQKNVPIHSRKKQKLTCI